MTSFAKILSSATGVAMIAGTAAPAAAQSPGYVPYNQGYNNQGDGVVGQVMNSILGGGRYGQYGQGQDRLSVDQCARAAEARVSHDYQQSQYGNYPQAYGNQGNAQQGYGQTRAGVARVVGITAVERRQNGVKVSGVMDSGRSQYRGGYGAYGNNGQGYPPQGYGAPAYPYQGYGNNAQVADLRFSCRVDFRGYVTDVDIKRNSAQRRRGS